MNWCRILNINLYQGSHRKSQTHLPTPKDDGFSKSKIHLLSMIVQLPSCEEESTPLDTVKAS